jgi:RecA-family ATPase
MNLADAERGHIDAIEPADFPGFAPYPDEKQDEQLAPLPRLDLARLAKTRATPTTFAIERIAPVGEVSLLYGAGSAGKSLLAQQLATAAAAGIRSCLGLEIIDAPAMYLTCEDPEKELHWRQEHICDTLRVGMASLNDRLYLSSMQGELGNALAVFGGDGTMVPSPMFARLSRDIIDLGAKLVLLDNVAHLFTGNENDRADVTRFINLLNRLAKQTGAAIVLIGHPNKGGDEYSGSTGWNNAVRSRMWLQKDEETGLVTLSLPKANYSQNGEIAQFRWYNWSFVRDDDLPADTAREMAESIKANSENRAFLACLAERNRQKRHVSEKPTAQNYAPKHFASMPEAKGHKKEALERAMDRLFRINAIERGFLWRDTAEGRDIIGLRTVEA